LPLSLYFSWHTPEAFTTEFVELFSAAEIFFVEYGYDSGLVEYHERLYNELSKGKKTPQQLAKLMSDPLTDTALYHALFEMISGRGKAVYLERSPLTVSEVVQMLTIEFKAVDLDKNLRAYKKKLAERADCEKRRDVSFARQLRECCETNPGREILVMRGAMHQRGLERFLRSEDVKFTSHLSHNPLPMDTQTEILSRLEIGEDVNRRELLMALVESIELKRRGYDPKTLKIAELVEIQNALAELSEKDLERYFGPGQ